MKYTTLRMCLMLCIGMVLVAGDSAKEQEPLEDVKAEIVVPVELVDAGETSQDAVEGSGDGGRKVRQYFGAPPFFGPPRPNYGGFGGGYGGGFGGGYGGGFGGGYQRTRVVTRTRVRGGYYGGGFGGGFGGGYYG